MGFRQQFALLGRCLDTGRRLTIWYWRGCRFDVGNERWIALTHLLDGADRIYGAARLAYGLLLWRYSTALRCKPGAFATLWPVNICQ